MHVCGYVPRSVSTQNWGSRNTRAGEAFGGQGTRGQDPLARSSVPPTVEPRLPCPSSHVAGEGCFLAGGPGLPLGYMACPALLRLPPAGPHPLLGWGRGRARPGDQ